MTLNTGQSLEDSSLTLLASGGGGGGCFPPPCITPLSSKLDYSNFVQNYFGIR